MTCNDNHNNSNAMPHQKPHLSKPKNSKMHSPLPLFNMNHFRKPGGDRKTVAYAVNYEPSLVDRFFASPSSSVLGNGVEGSLDTTTSIDNHTTSVTTNAIRKPGSVIVEDDEPSTANNKRRSTRGPKHRVVNMIPCKVRYDMESVPLVDRPKVSFWEDVKVWPPRAMKDAPPPIVTSSSKVTSYHHDQLGRPPNSSPQHPTPVPPSKPIRSNSPLPNSVLWKPVDRKDWEDSVGEMTAVCTSAALRKYTGPVAKFIPPLSKEYIKDRIDIDDPLEGYQIRHASGGWLQGFCLWTNFTTWTHHFAWDSLHPASGMDSCAYDKDVDGSLAKELQHLPRSGSPTDGGIVFEQIAEIALLGGLGCGELLLRMALEDILKRSVQQYKYIVLQATHGSRPFYERFGFKRVGAICRYATDSATATIETPTMNNENSLTCSNQNSNNNTSNNSRSEGQHPSKLESCTAPCSKSETAEANPIQGYRHWTHHNESQHSLDLHGGPSYMMCLKLPEEPMEGLNLLDELKNAFVTEKPTIQSIGGGNTPTTTKRKLKRQSSIGSLASPLPFATTSLLSSSSIQPTTTTMEELISNKRRKVSMDRLELGESASLAHNGLSRVVGVARKTTTKSIGRSDAKPVRERAPSKALVTSSPPPARPEAMPTIGVQTIDRTQLVKQKVKSYPRDRVHFYNKVVQPIGSKNGPYYFCLHYNKTAQIVTLCPMEPKGTLSGKRSGRPRYQCVLNATSENWITAPTTMYEAVPAFMVMKTPLIVQEAWDINTMT